MIHFKDEAFSLHDCWLMLFKELLVEILSERAVSIKLRKSQVLMMA